MSIRLDHGEDSLDVVQEINATLFIDVMLVHHFHDRGAAGYSRRGGSASDFQCGPPRPRSDEPIFLTICPIALPCLALQWWWRLTALATWRSWTTHRAPTKGSTSSLAVANELSGRMQLASLLLCRAQAFRPRRGNGAWARSRDICGGTPRSPPHPSPSVSS